MPFSFLGRGQESPALQLYGKLPVAKDYLRIGCGDGSGRDLREWLDRAFGTVREAAQQPVLNEPLRFLGLDPKEPLQGYLWPSSDAGGLRSFPFTLFVERRRRSLAADFDAGLAEAEGVWRMLAEMRERCLEFSDGRELLEEHRGRELEIGPDDRVESEPADFDAWVGALWPAEGLDGLFEVFEKVGALARERYAGPYRMPLVRELSLRDQVIGWTSLLTALGALPEDELPTLFFPPRSLAPPPDAASVVVSRRPLADDQVAWLTATGEDALGSADFTRGHDGAPPGVSSPTQGGSRLREALKGALVSFGSRKG